MAIASVKTRTPRETKERDARGFLPCGGVTGGRWGGLVCPALEKEELGVEDAAVLGNCGIRN